MLFSCSIRLNAEYFHVDSTLDERARQQKIVRQRMVVPEKKLNKLAHCQAERIVRAKYKPLSNMHVPIFSLAHCKCKLNEFPILCICEQRWTCAKFFIAPPKIRRRIFDTRESIQLFHYGGAKQKKLSASRKRHTLLLGTSRCWPWPVGVNRQEMTFSIE